MGGAILMSTSHEEPTVDGASRRDDGGEVPSSAPADSQLDPSAEAATDDLDDGHLETVTQQERLTALLATPGFAEWAERVNSAGLDWTKLRSDVRNARLMAQTTQDQVSHEFELERQRLQAQADQAQAEVDHRDRLHAVELEKLRLEARLRYQNDRVRSTVLLLVVLALVLMPVLAMLSPNPRIAPEEFTQYIAPIVGIAGTVLGYWFGKHERST